MFDETYEERYYRNESVMKLQEQCDALIVVGTALQTNLARQIVNKTASKDCLVIEFNPEPCIDDGLVLQIKEPCDKSLPKLVSKFLSLVKDPKVKPIPVDTIDKE